MKIECHNRELEISILEHTQNMQAEQEKKKMLKKKKGDRKDRKRKSWWS